MIEDICFNKFLGKCPKCIPDFDTTHHPNNLDCQDFKPFRLTIYTVKNKEEDKNNRRYINV